MPSKQFRYVSPGVQIKEIDESGLPREESGNVGPVVIGRASRGPAMVPTTVNSFDEFVNIFGQPESGNMQGDIWREGNKTAPTYGAYAAQAWLKRQPSLTFVRLLGDQSPNASDAGKAGWQTAKTTDPDVADNGGAYGLFIIDEGNATSNLTGTLAAVFYLQEGAIQLTGLDRDDVATSGTAVMIKGTNKTFKAEIYDATDTLVETKEFNFNTTSDRFIRKVFNTSPVLTNSSVISAENRKTYWLGETFERNVNDLVTTSTQLAFIAALDGPTATKSGSDFRAPNQSAATGWIFGQDLSDSATFDPKNAEKLFRIVSLYGGEWDSKNLKVSIQDIKPSPNLIEDYGTFSVVIRRANDSDSRPEIVEQFNNLNLNPSSPNFIAARIGDKQYVWDDVKKKYEEHGIYANQSSYIRVEMNENIYDGLHNPVLLPFGAFGPLKHKGFSVLSGTTGPLAAGATDEGDPIYAEAFVKAGASIPKTAQSALEFVNVGTTAFTGTFVFPSIPLREKAIEDSLPNPKRAYFGIKPTTSQTSQTFEKSYADCVRRLSGDYSSESEGDHLEYSWIFTLDDVSGSSDVNSLSAPAEYNPGSRVAGTSISAVNGWSAVLDNGHNRFTIPLHGGFDGFDVTEMEPLRNSKIGSNATETSDHVFYTYRKAIDTIADPEVVEHSLATIPGLTNEALTTILADTCKNRADTLAIIDIQGGFIPRAESTATFSDRIGDTQSITSALKSRSMNNSYACTYDPWVQIRDSSTGSLVFVPPSTVALGVMGNTDKTAAPWIAPAGFSRGGLTVENSGLDVVNVTRRLESQDRDELYTVGVNPIARFPNQGIVVYGQKTLQIDRSSLDRINVRRLVNLLKRLISQVAQNTIFGPNVRDTWVDFESSAKDILDSAQAGLGIEKYELIFDERTITPDLIDRNIVYGKIKILPVKAIEFIAIDFEIAKSGASFAD